MELAKTTRFTSFFCFVLTKSMTGLIFSSLCHINFVVAILDLAISPISQKIYDIMRILVILLSVINSDCLILNQMSKYNFGLKVDCA